MTGRRQEKPEPRRGPIGGRTRDRGRSLAPDRIADTGRLPPVPGTDAACDGKRALGGVRGGVSIADGAGFDPRR